MCPSPALSTSDHQPSRAEAFYRALLEYYPADFREQYREEMAQVFSATWTRLRPESLSRRLRYGAHVLRDWLGSLIKEWLIAAPWPTKWGCAGLAVAVSLDIAGRAYFDVLLWLAICTHVAVVGFLFLRKSRLSGIWLAILATGFTATGFFIPIWLQPLQHLSIADSDYKTVAKLTSTAVGLLVGGYSFFHYQNALIQPKPLGAIPRQPGAYRMTLWIFSFSAPTVGAIYFMAYHGLKGLADGSQLFFATFMLFTTLTKTYFYSAAETR